MSQKAITFTVTQSSNGYTVVQMAIPTPPNPTQVEASQICTDLTAVDTAVSSMVSSEFTVSE